MSDAEHRMIRLLGDAFVKGYEKSISAARLQPELREMRALLDTLAQEDARAALAPQSYYCSPGDHHVKSVLWLTSGPMSHGICFPCLKENNRAQESIGITG